MKKIVLAAAFATAALPALAQEATTADPFVSTQNVEPIAVVLGFAALALAVSASSGTD